jgi:hypothetical protein
MHLLPVVLIVATLGIAPIDARYPQAVAIYSCGFEQPTDRNYDGWPDEWTRRRGPGYPHYLSLRISQEPSSEGRQCLRMTLDGGAALAQSPPIEIEPAASYVLEAFIRTESLVRDEAFAAITFLDQNKQPLETARLPGVRDASQWRKVRLGPVATSHAAARYAVVELGVGPVDGEDLRGAALFDDIWFARLPRMSVRTNRPSNLFQPEDTIEVVCQVSGFDEEQAHVVFDLMDVDGQSIARHETALGSKARTRESRVEAQRPAGPRSGDSGLSALDTAGEAISWPPPIKGPGFYRVRVAMRSGDRQILERELSLAVIEPRTGAAGGEFGWSLSKGPEPLALPELAQLVSQVGISWVKYPLWLSEEDLARNDELVRFVERLGSQQIEIVGLLCHPPAKLRTQFGRKDTLTAADIFTPGPEVWYPSLEPVLTQLSMKVRWWQLGVDEDTSFVGYPLISDKVAEVKRQMDRIGQDTRLGFGWNWMEEDPLVRQPPWRFVNMATDPPLTAGDLATYLAQASPGGTERWVMIEPLDRADYDTGTRAADLVQRLLVAKKHGALRIFATQPFSTRRGLLNDDGTPGELLCPWLTTAATLSGSKHLGRLPMAGGSSNEIFARPGGEAAMFVWSPTRRRETLDLGEQLQHIDLWGRRLAIQGEGSQRTIEVGPMPSLVTGVPEAVVRCALTFEFEQDRFPSVLGQAHTSGVRLVNCFPRGASGKLRLVTPEGWIVEPRVFDFKLAAGEEFRAPFELRFPYDANNGVQEVRVEVLVAADRSHQFSIHRKMQLGLGDLALEASTELSENGELVVHQRLVNHTENTVSFKCDLYATNRRRLRTQVLDLGRGEDVQTYRLPAGRELLGQTLWIRAEEVGGQRALSHRFRAEE